MSRNNESGRAPTRGTSIMRGVPAARSLIPIRSSPAVTIAPGVSISREVDSYASRARTSILQSAREVSIAGGNFNTAGTQQLNFTFNLGDQRPEADQERLVGSRSDYQGDSATRDTPQEPLENRTASDFNYRYYDSTPRPPVQRSCDIYHRLIAVKGRGSPLWIPGPNQSLHISYQRQGMAIGDVGIITRHGSFDFLFNICLPRDDPINPPDLPENFTTLSLSQHDIQKQSEFVGESYLSSGSVKKSRSGDRHILTFESSASEGAVLTMPVGSNSADIGDIARFRKYLAANAERWYKYILGVRWREPQNGDLVLVTGWDKTKTWGMATFSNQTAQHEPFLLQFRPVDQGNADTSYGWDYSGFGEVRTGPGAQENERLRMGDPSQAGMEYENQCLFIRTLTVTLQDEVWNKLALEFGLPVEVDEVEGQSKKFGTSYSQSSREGSKNASGSSSRSSHSSFASGPGGRTASVATSSANEDIPTPRGMLNPVKFPASKEALTVHPSKGINNILLNLKPTARIAINADRDWISVLRVDDTVLPTTEHLFERMMQYFVLCEDEDTVFLKKKESSSPSAPFFKTTSTTPSTDLDSKPADNNFGILVRELSSHSDPISSQLVPSTAVENTTNPKLVRPLLSKNPSKARQAKDSGGSDAVTRLNNYLQSDRRILDTLGWDLSHTGPQHDPIWTVHCKIRGVIMGTGRGRSRIEAKKMAGGQALAALQAADTLTSSRS